MSPLAISGRRPGGDSRSDPRRAGLAEPGRAWTFPGHLCRVASMPGPKMSRSTLEVLAYCVEAKQKPVYGNQIIKDTGLKSGTIYPILDRLERAGWLTAEWEGIDESAEKRPRRRNYRL